MIFTVYADKVEEVSKRLDKVFFPVDRDRR